MKANLPKLRRLRWEKFCLAYAGPALANATRAALMAGYSPKSARFHGCRLLRRPEIQAYMAAVRSLPLQCPHCRQRTCPLCGEALQVEVTLDRNIGR